MMTAVVREGTGHNAAIPGYDVAGKTGTAQKLDPATRRYSRAPGVLSFVGFVPADDPRLTMLVMLDEPKNEKWGSEAAAPIFASIGREALRYLNVPPRNTAPVALVRGEIGTRGAVHGHRRRRSAPRPARRAADRGRRGRRAHAAGPGAVAPPGPRGAGAARRARSR